MNTPALKVDRIKEYGDAVGLHFTDGKELFLYGYSDNGPWGNYAEDLAAITLRQDGRDLAQYTSRKFHAGPQLGEHCLVAIADDCTPEQIATYFFSADNQLRPEDPQIAETPPSSGALWFARVLLGRGNMDASLLAAGKTALDPSNQPPTRLPSASEFAQAQATRQAEHEATLEAFYERDRKAVRKALADRQPLEKLLTQSTPRLARSALQEALQSLLERGEIKRDGDSFKLTPLGREQVRRDNDPWAGRGFTL